MQEEIFPLVNEEGEVIGQATRSQCHNGSMLLHPVVHVHIFDEKGRLYLQRRSSKKDIFPDLWDSSVGGHIAVGETPEQAAVREAWEEVGLKHVGFYFIEKHITETQYERELTYCFCAVTSLTLQPDMDEVVDGRFWNIKEIESALHSGVFTPNFELDFKLFLNKGFDKLIVD